MMRSLSQSDNIKDDISWFVWRYHKENLDLLVQIAINIIKMGLDKQERTLK